MAKRMNEEERFDARDRARWKADEKAYDLMCLREERAEREIGELCRDGKQVFYVSPIAGKYREGSRSELIAYLIRNHHV